MTTLVRPERQTPGMRTAPNTVQTVLLAGGVAASLLYALAHDALAALLYPGYSPFSQTISELGSPGAPTRAGVTAVVVVFDLLFAAFGVGVMAGGYAQQPSVAGHGRAAGRLGGDRADVVPVPDDRPRGHRRQHLQRR